ncbi:MAG: hypothetical protein WBK67_01960 [Minisyncoccales bacterium]
MIAIENAGPRIVSSTYWDSELNARGVIVCSLNAGAFRLLLPDSLASEVPEMSTGKEVIVSKGAYRGQKGYEFLFDDHSESPYSILIGWNQMVTFHPADREHGKAIQVSVWIRGSKEMLNLPGWFRVVQQLPCLKPWAGQPG